MRSISIFNNKGGVGKTTLTFHFANALAELGKKTLVIDLDPQCNLTIFCMKEAAIGEVWEKEERYIEDFDEAKSNTSTKDFQDLSTSIRSIHFALKPAEDGFMDLELFPKPQFISANFDLIPGRLSLHTYEDKLSSRWSDVFVGDPLALRTVTNIRRLAEKYAEQYNYEYVIFDTSPSLGILNRVILSLTDGFIIPCNPDLFSLYGIRNIGRSLSQWQANFDVLKSVLPKPKLKEFPGKPVQFLGYTIYNARRYTGEKNVWNLASGHYNYAQQIPSTIESYIGESLRASLNHNKLSEPIGGTSVMYSHSTMATHAQKYNAPIWRVPDAPLDADDKSTVSGNKAKYKDTQEKYRTFAKDAISRLDDASI